MAARLLSSSASATAIDNSGPPRSQGWTAKSHKQYQRRGSQRASARL